MDYNFKQRPAGQNPLVISEASLGRIARDLSDRDRLGRPIDGVLAEVYEELHGIDRTKVLMYREGARYERGHWDTGNREAYKQLAKVREGQAKRQRVRTEALWILFWAIALGIGIKWIVAIAIVLGEAVR